MHLLFLLRYFFKKLEQVFYFNYVANRRENFDTLEAAIHKPYRAGVLMLV
jgi:hypothetical protein